MQEGVFLKLFYLAFSSELRTSVLAIWTLYAFLERGRAPESAISAASSASFSVIFIKYGIPHTVFSGILGQWFPFPSHYTAYL